MPSSYFLITDAMCPALDAPANGQIMYDSDMSAPFDFRTTATYDCDSGYGLSGGTSVRTCESEGWSGSAPTCQRECHESSNIWYTCMFKLVY